MLRPTGLDEYKKYPLIHYVYVSRGQTVRDVWLGNRSMWHMMMSQQGFGFLVSSIENRGKAAPRGHDWRRSIYASDGDVKTQDQSDAINASREDGA
jgi:dipeptidyl-peptidase-4